MLSSKLEARFLKQLWKQSVPSSMLPAVYGSALARRCWQHLCEYVVFRLSLEICVKPISQLIICEHCFVLFGDCAIVPWKCICRGKVSWTASSCPCGSWKVLCLKQCRIAKVCNMSHVPAGLVGSGCWHTCMEYSKGTRTASVEVCLHDRYTLR